MGESISKGVIVDWHAANGSFVRETEPLFEFETDKATVVVPAMATGIVEILAPKETEVSIGQTIGTVDTRDAGVEGPKNQGQSVSSAVTRTPALSPAVQRVLSEKKLDPASIPGSGKGGRITKADALSAGEKPTVQAAAVSPKNVQPGSPAPQGARPTTRVKMTTLRKRTADRLVLARQQAVHVTTYNEIDMSGVMAIRSHHHEAFEKEHGIKLGFMSFFVKACCKALALHRELNAEIDGGEIVYHDFYNIGVAISLDRGLVVPVVRNADRLTFADIETAVAGLAKRARDKSLTPDELAGGTFTITNGGVYGSLMSTPVPAYPQVAILGMHAIKKRPVVADDAVVVRPMMYVALTYDHRIVDGKDAIGFLVKVKEFIEQPDSLLLEM